MLSGLAYGKHMIQSALVPGDNGAGDSINPANASRGGPTSSRTGVLGPDTPGPGVGGCSRTY